MVRFSRQVNQMNTSNTMAHFHIGEIEISDTSTKKQATLPCQMPKKSRLILRLFDKYGINCRKEEFHLKKGDNSLELDCTSLEGGDYSAWIELEGKTYLRGFSIQEEKKQKSFFQRFRDLLQPKQFDGAYY